MKLLDCLDIGLISYKKLWILGCYSLHPIYSI